MRKNGPMFEVHETAARPLTLLYVRVDVEVGEEDDKGGCVANESVVHPLREVAVDVE